MPLAPLTLPVMSSQGVVVYRVERWNKATGRYVAWRPLEDGSPRINEFPPDSHDLLRADPAARRARAAKPDLPLAPEPEPERVVHTAAGESDETFLRALGFELEELPNQERLAPYLDGEARKSLPGHH